MISQAFIIRENMVLMVKQYTTRGAIVWTFPGGHIEQNESPIQACIREVKEETNYDINIKELLYSNYKKYIYLCEITGGILYINKELSENKELIDAAWVSFKEDVFDSKTIPIINIYLDKKNH